MYLGIYLVCIALVFECRTWACSELYAATSELELLLKTHKKIIEDLDDYVQKGEKRLGVLKQYLNTFKREHEMAMADVENYLSNPITAFTLIKRLTIDLKFIESIIKKGTEDVWNATANKEMIYPTDEDLQGAAHALKRLQNMYRMDVDELAQGRLHGVAYSAPLSASDCYELGRVLHVIDAYPDSMRWMQEALRKYKEEGEVYNLTEVDILEHISYLYYLLGDGQTALEWASKLLSLDPNNQHAVKYIPYYLKRVTEMKKLLEMKNEEDEDEYDTDLETPRRWYEALCRGEMELPTQIVRNLKCSYLTENHPFLKLAPIKREQLYIAPDVFIYHQVMSDEEIEYIKAMARPRLQRAAVGSHVPTILDYRVAKRAWLVDEESAVVARVSQRIADFTGLTMDSAEALQVVNYGVGGHYEPHFDFTLRRELSLLPVLDERIATAVFYMSDVAQGGATVFLQLGLTVFPVKNSALFWRNLHPSCERDISTLHAGCPVLRGSKWISNKWIHQLGQEFRAPCDLQYQPQEVMRKLIKPKFKVQV